MLPVSEFKKRTGYDIESFFERFNSFYLDKYPIIESYFSGKNVANIRGSFLELKKLIAESNRISTIIDINHHTLSEDTSYWSLIELFEDVKIRLKTIENLPKYLRSTYYSYYDKYHRSTYISSQEETPEMISRKFGLLEENSWVDLLLFSDLEEIDYNHNGNSVFRLNISNKTGLDIKSVVDVITGDNILGKDILNEIVYENDDLKYLQPMDTLYQSADILLSLRRGDTPEYFNYGVDIVEGSTKTAFDYPIVIRQLIQSFSTDDSFDSIHLIDISANQDSITLQIEIRSRMQDILLVKEYSL